MIRFERLRQLLELAVHRPNQEDHTDEQRKNHQQADRRGLSELRAGWVTGRLSKKLCGAENYLGGQSIHF